MSSVTIWTDQQRRLACDVIARLEPGSRVTFSGPRRSLSQNARMWAMLSSVSRQLEHNGEKYPPETWKAIFMHALGHEIRMVAGLDGEPFPLGYQSSRLSVSQMSDLMEFIAAEGIRRGVDFSQ